MKHVLAILLTISLILFYTFELYAQTIIEVDTKVDTTVVIEAMKERLIPKYSSVATKIDVPLQQIPMSVSVVNSNMIENQNNFVLGDAVTNVSGVNTQTGNGVHDYFIIRGLNSLDNGLILTDGTMEPEVTYYNLYNVDRIEVLKGPGAFLYGSNPLSGTVNLVRKQPMFNKFIAAHSTMGQFNTYRNSIDVGIGDTQKKFAIRLNALWENADNYRNDKKNEIVAINPAITYYLTPKTTVNVNAEYINSKYKPDSGIPLVYNFLMRRLNRLADVPRTNSYQTPFDFSNQKITRVKMSVEQKLTEAIAFQSKIYFTRLDWNSQGTLINGAFPNEWTGKLNVSRSMSYIDDVRDVVGNQNEFTLSVASGGLKHELLAGFEWNVLQEDYMYDVAQTIPSIDLYNPVETAVQSQIIYYPYLRGDVKNVVLAPYALDQVAISDQLQMTLGVRYDYIQFENKAAGYLADRSYRQLNPMLGINYSPVQQISLYANSGQAFASPSSQIVGDQEAETSRQYEAGVKQVWFDGRANLDVACYFIIKENIVIPGMDGISKQLGDMESKGVEVDLRLEPLHDWFATVSYALSDVKLTRFYERVPVGKDQYGMPIYMMFDRTGNRSPFTPMHILNFWTTKAMVNGLGVGVGARYLSSQFIASDNVYQIDAAFTLNAIVYYTMGPARFSLNFKNMTDEAYEIRGFNNSSVIPAAPRAIYGKIDVAL
ncbi:TonB-dependent siderophore receptor [candidate division KSB1 bacterium]|nr:TonB-dependent siderophore receptor [candidate division KSB1 bacterium]